MSNSRSVIFLFTEHSEQTVEHIYIDDNGLLYYFRRYHMWQIMANIYGPNNDNPLFYETIIKIMKYK